jgi:hypothetical protein
VDDELVTLLLELRLSLRARGDTPRPRLLRVSHPPSLILSRFVELPGVETVLSARDCLAPDRGVLVWLRYEPGGAAAALSPRGDCALTTDEDLRASGVVAGGPLTATLGVRGVRVMPRGGPALSWGWRGLSPGGIVAASLLVEERVVGAAAVLTESTCCFGCRAAVGRVRGGPWGLGGVEPNRGAGVVVVVVVEALVAGRCGAGLQADSREAEGCGLGG